MDASVSLAERTPDGKRSSPHLLIWASSFRVGMIMEMSEICRGVDVMESGQGMAAQSVLFCPFFCGCVDGSSAPGDILEQVVADKG